MDKRDAAADVIECAAQEGRIGFSLQDITSVDTSGDRLYAQCLGRLVRRDGLVFTESELTEEFETVAHIAAFGGICLLWRSNGWHATLTAHSVATSLATTSAMSTADASSSISLRKTADTPPASFSNCR